MEMTGRLTGFAGIPSATIRCFSGKLLGNAIHQIVELLEWPQREASIVRVVTTKESTYVGRCIYCGETQGQLTEEHVSPFGLNGLITLLAASCPECNKATSRIEDYVLRRMWGAARAEMGYRTRHKKGASDLYPLTVIQDGTKNVREVPLKDALKIIELPIFGLSGDS